MEVVFCIKQLTDKIIDMRRVLTSIKFLPALVGFFLIQLSVMAQDTSYSTTTNTDSEELWYLQPWVWVVGGVVLLLLLIALFSGGKKKNNNSTRTDKVIITKTVRTETDVDDK